MGLGAFKPLLCHVLVMGLWDCYLTSLTLFPWLWKKKKGKTELRIIPMLQEYRLNEAVHVSHMVFTGLQQG